MGEKGNLLGASGIGGIGSGVGSGDGLAGLAADHSEASGGLGLPDGGTPKGTSASLLDLTRGVADPGNGDGPSLGGGRHS